MNFFIAKIWDSYFEPRLSIYDRGHVTDLLRYYYISFIKFSKGQKISKAIYFVLNSSKKTNEIRKTFDLRVL